jgi:translation elongation factor EF-4
MPPKGVEAQTLANVYQAIDNNHEIIPVINKIDLPAADIDKAKKQIEDVIGLDASDAVSRVRQIRPEYRFAAGGHRHAPARAQGQCGRPTKALLVDSWYDAYLGVVILVRVIDGYLRKGQKIKFMKGGATREIDRVGMFTPKHVLLDVLGPGEMGFITASIKDISDTKVGDTITDDRNPAGRTAARFQTVDPDGVLLALSRWTRGNLKNCATAGQTRAERFLASLRNGNVAGAGPRFPLRVFGPAAYGDHSGTFVPRIRPRPHPHGAQRGV